MPNDGNSPVWTLYVYGNSKLAITKSTTPESTLKKKRNSICYHAICESVAMGESLLMHVGTHDNLADLLTKPTFGAKRQRLVNELLYDIFDNRISWQDQSTSALL